MLRALLFLLGLAVIVAAIERVSIPAAGIVGGAFLCGLAYYLERDHLSERDKR